MKKRTFGIRAIFKDGTSEFCTGFDGKVLQFETIAAAQADIKNTLAAMTPEDRQRHYHNVSLTAEETTNGLTELHPAMAELLTLANKIETDPVEKAKQAEVAKRMNEKIRLGLPIM